MDWLKMQFLSTPSAFHAFIRGDPIEIRQDLWHQKTESPWATVWHCLVADVFSHFDRTLTCGGHRGGLVSVIAIFVLKRDVKLQLTNIEVGREIESHSIYCASMALHG